MGWQQISRRPAISRLVWLAAAIAGLELTSSLPSHATNACVDLALAAPADRIKALARGVNLAGWMDDPRTSMPDIAVLRTLRRYGITHIRLPVPAERVMRRFASQQDLSRQLAIIDRALTELISIGYSVSIDLHPGEPFGNLHRDSVEQSMEAMRDAWTNLAPIILRHPRAPVFAELLNEPDVDPQRWQLEVEQLAAFVRRLLPQTTLIVGPTNWQRADSLPDFRPLSDPNVVYAIHFYDPMVFTHQGHWDPSEPLSGVRGLPFPIERDSAIVEDVRQRLAAEGKQRALDELDKAIDEAEKGDVVGLELEPAVAWQKRYLRPLIVNEFGVLKGQAPPESRARWLRSVVNFAEQHCWGWTHWELAQGFGLLDEKTGKPDPAVMRALLGRP
jgi:endoglucanase